MKDVQSRRPSPFEERWQHACSAQATTGFASKLITNMHHFCGEGFHAHWRELCSKQASEHAPVQAALMRAAAEFEACFAKAEPGSWVSVTATYPTPRSASPGLPAPTAMCVAHRVAEVLATVDTTGIDEIMVPMKGDVTPKGIGSLSKEVIRQHITKRIGEVRGCFESALTTWPQLRGRVVVKFVIGSDGRVPGAKTLSSELSNPAVECCINTAVHAWRFPVPNGGGIVVVTYPFVLDQVP